MNIRYLYFLSVIITGLGLSACNTTTVKTTEHEAIVHDATPIPEEQLLDIGVGIFNPGVDAISTSEEGVYPKVRDAEARYIPYKLMETLQQTGNWGVVRVIPNRQSEMDLWVDGEILKSDGELLELRVKVQDASGKTWYTKDYSESASKYAYDNSLRNREDPFQGLYNRIANDLMQYYRRLGAAQIEEIRTISKLKFAQRFSPEAFSDYLEVDSRGRYKIKRLPADNDPVLQRVKRIRERDYMFVDTLQDYYGSFVQRMDGPYTEWRKQSYEESTALRELKGQATTRMLGGALAVLAGILAQGSDSAVARSAGVVGIGAGALAFKSGLDKNSEAKIHAEALEELGESLNAEIEPHSIALEDRTVTLSGTVDEQYGQWRRILKEIYMQETGQTEILTN